MSENQEYSDDPDGFPPEERKLVTQSYDLSIQTLTERWDNEELTLPEIQREYVWDNNRASKLIESLLLNVPIPVLYFAETPTQVWEVFDGQQRITSVVRFLDNQFKLGRLSILSDLSGSRFHQLPEREQRYLKSRMMRAVVISNDSHPSMKFEIFERLNSGSVVLNAQELRNSLYRGSFNSKLRELVNVAAFRNCLGSSKPRRRMVDEEFVLRFFSMAERPKNYKTPLKKYLNDYMQSVQNLSEAKLNSLEDKFVKTVEAVNDCWGDAAFRVTDRKGNVTERAPNRALFDAQMVAFSRIPDGLEFSTYRRKVRDRFADLYEDPEFVDSIRLATGDRSKTLFRIRKALDALESCGIAVDRSYVD